MPTILKSRLNMTKEFVNKDGVIQTNSYGNAKNFEHANFEPTSLSELATAIDEVSKDKGLCLVRGSVKPEFKDSARIRRCIIDQKEGAATLEQVDLKWAMIDIDSLENPFGEPESADDLKEIVEHAVSKLPEAFKNASYYARFSSSFGVHNYDTIKVHIFFWFDRAVYGRSLRRWLAKHRAVKIDLSVFGDAQIHYIADPILTNVSTIFDREDRGLFVDKSNSHVVLPDCVVTKEEYNKEKEELIDIVPVDLSNLDIGQSLKDEQERLYDTIDKRLQSAEEGERHGTLLAMTRLAAGYVAGGMIQDPEGLKQKIIDKGLEILPAKRHPEVHRTVGDAWNIGQEMPISHEDVLARRESKKVHEIKLDLEDHFNLLNKVLSKGISATSEPAIHAAGRIYLSDKRWLETEYFQRLDKTINIAALREAVIAKSKLIKSKLDKEARQKENEKILARQRSEGKIVLMGCSGGEIADDLVNYLKKKHGTNREPLFGLGRLHVYDSNKGIWVGYDPKQLTSLIYKKIDGASYINEKGELQIYRADTRSVKNVAQAIEAKAHSDKLDRSLGLTTRDCHIQADVMAGELRFVEKAPKHLSRHYIDYEVKEPNCPRFLQFLDEVFEPDAPEEAKAKKQVLAEFVGACLLGIPTFFEAAVFLTGSGSNGKSVFLDIVKQLFVRDGLFSAVEPTKLCEPFNAYLLTNSRFNMISDMSATRITKSGEFKRAISGEDLLACQKYQDGFLFQPEAGHIFSVNQLPATSDFTEGFFRRWIIIEFNRKFEDHEKNPTLGKEIIQNELEGVFNWAINGAKTLLSNKLYTKLESSDEAKKIWESETDVIVDWLVGDGNSIGNEPIPVVDLYQKFCTWCPKNGINPSYIPTRRRFVARLKNIGFWYGQLQIKDKRRRCFKRTKHVKY